MIKLGQLGLVSSARCFLILLGAAYCVWRTPPRGSDRSGRCVESGSYEMVEASDAMRKLNEWYALRARSARLASAKLDRDLSW
ncbi:hypothetical protein C8Q73DRAFT_677931 [Cubamyces lactineus]|nr:hypothetical protein C8Q73DRAFT_677931 [Cubamyces lactineus]